MQLKVLGSGSSGNCYLLEAGNETLVIECGLAIKHIKEGLNHNIANVVGVLVTHEHGDHCKAADKVAELGVNLYMSAGTANKLTKVPKHRVKRLKPKETVMLGNFKVMPFNVIHDAAEPFGFLIHHPDCGVVVYITDTGYLPHTFPGVNTMLIECNYDEDILDANVGAGRLPEFVGNRIRGSHLSYKECETMVLNQDMVKLNNIVLLHLSDGNSHEENFKAHIRALTGCNVYAANKGDNININLKPF